MIPDDVERILQEEDFVELQQRLNQVFYDPSRKREVLGQVRLRLVARGSPLETLEELTRSITGTLAMRAIQSAEAPRPDPREAQVTLTGPELEDLIIERFPMPIAQSYRAMVEQPSASSGFGCALDTFESLLNYLAAVVTSAYLRTPLAHASANRLILEKLLKSAWTTGDRLDLLTGVLREVPDLELPYPKLRPHLFTRSGKPSAAQNVLSALVLERNRKWGHASGRNEAFFAEALPAFRARLDEELGRMHWLSEVQLVRPTAIDESPAITHADLLLGDRTRRNRPFHMPLDPAEFDSASRALLRGEAVLLTEGEPARYLTLYPLSLYKLELCSQGLYFVDRLVWKSAEAGRKLQKATFITFSAALPEMEERSGEPAVEAFERRVAFLEAQLGEALPPAIGEAADLVPKDWELPEVELELETHLRCFVGREHDRAEVERWISYHGSGYLVLTGEPGRGKSAFLAHLVEAWGRDGCLYHFVKSHPDPVRFVVALIAQAARRGGWEMPASGTSGTLDDLRNELLRMLQRLAKESGRVILVVDALDELRGSLEFLPPNLPNGVVAVLSCRPRLPLLGALQVRLGEVTFHPLESLTLPDFERFVLQELQGEEFPAAWRETLEQIFNRARGNALLLRRAARLIGRQGRSEARVPDMSELPAELEQLFDGIYREIASGEDKARAQVKGRIVQLLAIGRAALSFAEIAELLTLDGVGTRTQQARELCHEISEYLLSSGAGRVLLWHQSFAEFIRETTLGPRELLELENLFCDWTGANPGTRYSVAFRPTHLLQAGRFDELQSTLLDLEFLARKVEMGMAVDLLQDLELGQSGPSSPLAHLTEALRSDMQHLLRHPQTLFQWLWNRLRWQDSGSFSFERWLEKARPDEGRIWLEGLVAPVTRLGEGELAVLPSYDHPRGLLALDEDRLYALSWWGYRSLRVSDPCEQPECRFPPGLTFCCFLESGLMLLQQASTDDETLEMALFDPETGSILARYERPPGKGPLLGSGDGRWLAIGGESLQVVALGDEAPVRHYAVPPGRTASPRAFSRDGRYLVIEHGDASREMYECEFDLEAVDLSTSVSVTLASGVHHPGIAMHPRLPRICLVDHRAPIREVSLEDGRQISEMTSALPLADWLEGLAYSPDGRLLATGGATVTIWDLQAGTPVATYGGHLGLVRGTAFLPGGRRLASAADDGTVRVWDLAVQIVDDRHGAREHLMRVAYSPDGSKLAAVALGGTVQIFDAADGTERIRLSGGEHECYLLQWLSDDLVCCGGLDGLVVCWSVSTGEEALRAETTPDQQPPIGVHPSSGEVALPSPDGRLLRTYDVGSGEVRRVFAFQDGYVSQGAWSRDGELLGLGGMIPEVLRVRDGATLWRAEEAAGRRFRHTVAFSPVSDRMAVAGDVISYLVDVQTGERTILGGAPPVAQLPLPREGSEGMSFSSVWPVFSVDGQRVGLYHCFMSSGGLKVFDARTGELLTSMSGATDPSGWLAPQAWTVTSDDVETCVIDRRGRGVAWAPRMDELAVSHRGHSFAGLYGHQLYLFRVHGPGLTDD